MKHFPILLLSLFTSAACFFTSCSEDDDLAPLFLVVTPDTTAVINVGQQQLYRIGFQTKDNQLVRNLRILSEDKNNAEKILLDTTFNVTPSEVKYKFLKDASYADEVILHFIATDVNGHNCRIDRNIKSPVVPTE